MLRLLSEDEDITVWKIRVELERLVLVAVVAAGGEESENVGENGLHDGDREQ